MTLPPLPEDLRRWPDDPFTVLGIPPGADKKTARRAYAKRIRQYRPEHSPEEFQRVREAYESVLQFISWGLCEPSHDDLIEGRDGREDGDVYGDDEDRRDAQKRQRADAGFAAASDAAIGGRVPPDVDEECRGLWEKAARGQPELAYAGLQEIRRREPQRTEAAVRLYWLSLIFPELDRDRRPIDWLWGDVDTCGLTGPVHELLRRELDRDPSEAVRPEFARMIRACGPTAVLLDFYGWRWQAAGQLQRHHVILDDIEQLRSGVAPTDAQLWGQLLLLALDHLAWMRDTDAKDAFARYVEEAEHVPLAGPSAHDELTRLDLLVEAARGWRKLAQRRQVPRHWVQVIPLTWTLPFDRVRPLLVPIAKEIARVPEDALDDFDFMIHTSPAAASQLGEAIERWSLDMLSPDMDHEDEEQLRAVATEFLVRNVRFHYNRMRRGLLTTCLNESLHPQTLAAALAGLGEYGECDCAVLADAIHHDAALRYVYLGVRVFLG
jgi:hypothetical protein